MANVIDRATAQRILDTADIVEVVSDFVSLKRRGSNYIGLCPFHQERTPSFSVSRAKGICKCFSCGKGGSAVGFIMEHEQLTYNEALRYLARKYHIEIQERELTDDERRAESERQRMLAANEYALKHFAHNLKDTDDGRDIGMAYFRHRGVNDWAIERFQLGYSLERGDDFLTAARNAGHAEEALLATGLVARSERGLYDRFRGRVMFPVFTISGKVVAFGGRTLRTDKNVAKYVNSPESVIYSKSNELYGLFQAKQAIVKANKCILVEGYLDVISMHQSGVENVVASSGTSLTQGQIRLIHRFTSNVTVIYDSDAAGIKASLRGIDLLLAEGLDIKVLSLPDGDDPDSYAQSHSPQEVADYLATHEVDFIRFKTRILLMSAGDDPMVRARVMADIVRSISVIPDQMKRAVYLQECAEAFGADERVLAQQVKVFRLKAAEERFKEAERKSAQPTSQAENAETAPEPPVTITDEAIRASQSSVPLPKPKEDPLKRRAAIVKPQERDLLRLVLKYGMLPLGLDFGTFGDGSPLLAIDYVAADMGEDNLQFLNPEIRATFERALELRYDLWPEAWQQAQAKAKDEQQKAIDDGLKDIAATAFDTAEITMRENKLRDEAQQQYELALHNFALLFLERHLTSEPDDAIRHTATDLVVEKYQLSRIYQRPEVKIETEEERLGDLISRSLITLKYDLARCAFEELGVKITQIQSTPHYDLDEVLKLMTQQRNIQEQCTQWATLIGERVVDPRRK